MATLHQAVLVLGDDAENQVKKLRKDLPPEHVAGGEFSDALILKDGGGETYSATNGDIEGMKFVPKIVIRKAKLYSQEASDLDDADWEARIGEITKDLSDNAPVTIMDFWEPDAEPAEIPAIASTPAPVNEVPVFTPAHVHGPIIHVNPAKLIPEEAKPTVTANRGGEEVETCPACASTNVIAVHDKENKRLGPFVHFMCHDCGWSKKLDMNGNPI